MKSDKVIIEEATRLVNEGMSVTLPVNGYSMLPFIIGGKESVILQKPVEPKVGDVVLRQVSFWMMTTAIQLCGAFLLMRWFDARLAWALLLLTPMAIVFGKSIARKLRQMTLDIRQDESRIQMQVQEGMEYNAVLRSLGSDVRR